MNATSAQSSLHSVTIFRFIGASTLVKNCSIVKFAASSLPRNIIWTSTCEHTLGRGRFSATSVSRDLPAKPRCKFIVVRTLVSVLINVMFVARILPNATNCRLICGRMDQRSGTSVKSASRRLLRAITCISTVGHIQARSHISARYAGNNSRSVTLFRYTREHTLARSHISVTSV